MRTSKNMSRTSPSRRTVRCPNTKASHDTRSALSPEMEKPCAKRAFDMVGAPGLEPGTR